VKQHDRLCMRKGKALCRERREGASPAQKKQQWGLAREGQVVKISLGEASYRYCVNGEKRKKKRL